MKTAIVRRIALAELIEAPNFAELCAEYAQESANSALGPVELDIDAYLRLEAIGMLHLLGAFSSDTLIGLVAVIVNTIPHYKGKRLAVTESIFVSAKHRRSGAGLRLLRAAQEIARAAGAAALCVSSPMHGRLAQVLPHVGFKPTNTFFFKALR